MRDRRRFLKHSAFAALGLTGLPLTRALGQAGGTKILAIHAMGGWDPVVCFNPKELTNTNVHSPDIAEKSYTAAMKLRNIGPGADGLFSTYTDQIAVIVGVDAQTVSHVAGYQVNVTGQTRQGQPDVGTMVAESFTGQADVPYFMFGGIPFLGDYAKNAAMTGFANQINELSQVVGPQAPKRYLQCVSGAWVEDWSTCGSIVTPDKGIYASSLRSAAFAPSGQLKDLLDAQFETAAADFAARPGMQTGRNLQYAQDYSLNAGQAQKIEEVDFGGSGFAVSTAERLEQARLKLIRRTSESKPSISAACFVATGENFDSHGTDSNAFQVTNQDALLGAIKAFWDHASDPGLSPGDNAASLAEELIIVVTSDFGRTPKVNASNGKDHWPVGATLVMGAGVAGGKTYGATDLLVNAEKVNLATGEVDSTGRKAEPKHIARAVLELADAEPDRWLPGVESYAAIKA